MNERHQKKIRNRTIFLAGIFIVWFLVTAGRLVQLQVIDHGRLKRIVDRQHRDTVEISPERGTIFDRRGNILATSLPCRSLYCQPSENIPEDRQYAEIRKLAGPLGLNSSDLKRIRLTLQDHAGFVWIRRKLPPALESKIRDRLGEGLHFVEESRRVYPQGRLAAHVLGRVNIDGKGQSGVELSYNRLLEGRSGKGLNLRDARRRKYRFEILENPVPGRDIYLTIDETIQYAAASELKRAMDEYRAEWGIVMVSRPGTGEILALANSPEPNPADPGSDWRRIDWNYAIRQNFDPGSTFKIITAAAALENGSAGLNDVYDVHLGYRSFGSSSIGDHHRYDNLDFRGVIIHSSNVGATMIADQVGPRRLYDTIRAFGLGHRTGIDLPAEEDGLLNPPETWTKYSHNYISVGYEINVTAAQMLQVINIVANDGISVPLRVVRPTREVTALSEEHPAPPRRVISEITARRLNDILIDVVKEGTGKPARVPGYTVAGKTGTAQRIDPESGSYSSRAHLSSFAGYAPAEHPELSIIVVIDRPQGKYYGGDVAAPVFAAIAARALRYLRIPESKADLDATLMTADLKGRERR